MGTNVSVFLSFYVFSKSKNEVLTRKMKVLTRKNEKKNKKNQIYAAASSLEASLSRRAQKRPSSPSCPSRPAKLEARGSLGGDTGEADTAAGYRRCSFSAAAATAAIAGQRRPC